MTEEAQTPQVAVDYDPFGGQELLLVVAATDAQREIWAAAQMGSDASCAFNESNTIRFKGPLDVDALRAAFAGLVARHDALRTTFSGDGRSLLIARSIDLPLLTHDLSNHEPEARVAAVDRHRRREVEEPFDLEKGPLLRVALFRLGAEDHELVFTFHHIVFDGWSTGVLVRELSLAYRAHCAGGVPQLPAPFPFSAYALERAEALGTAPDAAVEAFWVQRFSDSSPTQDLPVDFPRPPLKTYASARIDHQLEAGLLAELKRVGQQSGASLFAVMLSGFYAFLHRLTNEADIVMATSWAGQASSGHLDLVGHCVNTLPIRAAVLSDDTFASLLGRLRSVVLDASENSEYTLGRLLRNLPLPRDPSRLPLVSVLFNLDKGIAADGLDFGDVHAEFFSNPRSFENFDLFLNAVEAAEGLRLECQFNTDLFEAATIRRWLGSFELLLRSAAGGVTQLIEALPLVEAAELERLAAWNDSAAYYPRQLQLHQLVEQQAARQPDRQVLACGDDQRTFGELDRQANRLARRLRKLGVGPDRLVGLYLQRSLDLVVAMLAVSKSGGAYVPLDPAYPDERIRFMVDDSGMEVIITQDSIRSQLASGDAQVLLIDGERTAIDSEADSPLEPLPDASVEDPAYVIYTSGSTGKPKGVRVPHRAVVNFLAGAAARPGMTPDDVIVAVTTLAFDIAVLELWLPLSVGARVVLASREVAGDGAQLLGLARASRATMLQATPATWRLLIEAGWDHSDHLKVVCGGEALPPDLARELLERSDEVWNMYGPTETTVWSSLHRLSPGGPVLIGTPMANTQLYVLGPRLQQLPIGVPGELYIGGDGVTLGYHRRPELTADRFLPDPFRSEPAARLYRTGDVARWRPDGNLEYLGRNDHQVKVRGYRIELGEIESVLAGHDSVAQATAVAREDRPGDVRLVAYVVCRPGGEWREDVLRHHLRGQLPEYMVPQHLVRLDALPLTPNGKIDRKSLPAPDSSRAEGMGYIAPRNEAERLVATIWQEVMGIGRIGVHDDFFLLGGHSLLAAQVVARLAREQGVAIPMRQILEAPTVARFAPLLAAARLAQPVPRRSAAGPAPASVIQRRAWFLEQLGTGRRKFNMVGAWRVQGALDLPALEAAVAAFVARHESTRVSLRETGAELVQVVAPAPTSIDLTPIPIDAEDDAAGVAEVVRLLTDETLDRLDLAGGPLFEFIVFRLREDDHVLAVKSHQAIWDGWSYDILLRELDADYAAYCAGRPSPLPDPKVGYGDFAEFQQGWLAGPEAAQQAAYWNGQLAGGLQPLDLPGDRPRPKTLSDSGDTEWVNIPRSVADRLTALGRSRGATLYMVLLAAFEVLLHRYGGQNDFLIGTPVRGRSRPELADVVGPFVNTIVVRAQVDPRATFVELVDRVRSRVLEGMGNEEVPFEHLEMSRNQIYRAYFSYQDVRDRPTAIGSLRMSQVHVLRPVAAADVSLWVMENEDRLVGGLNYSTDLFDRRTMERFLTTFQVLLENIAKDPVRPIEALPAARAGHLRPVASGTDPSIAATPLHSAFERLAAENPSAVALVTGGTELTYEELADRARRLAGGLVQSGVAPGSSVAVCAAPGADRAAAIIAISMVGAACVPLDPAQPRPRLEEILRRARCWALLADSSPGDIVVPGGCAQLMLGAAGEGDAGWPDSDVASPAALDSIALVAFTSSAGGPVGVELSQEGISHTVQAVRSATGLKPGDRLVGTASLASGRSILEHWLALTSGAALVPASHNETADGEALRNLLQVSEATAMHAEPSTWDLLLDSGWQGGSGFLAIAGGAALAPRLAARLAGSAGRAFTVSGMAETGYWNGLAQVSQESSQAGLGKPLGDARWYVFDGRLNPVPDGFPGELVVSGTALASDGDVRSADRLFRTGDRVRVRGDGLLEWLGRCDDRLSVRGVRLDPAEVERALEAHPGVRRAGVGTYTEREELRLVAHVVRDAEADFTDTELRRHLRQLLPDEMVPRRFVHVDVLSEGPGRSLDRSRLDLPPAAGTAELVEPRTDCELLLAEIWQQALGVSQVSATDNFFDLGGHSLLCLQVLAQIESVTGRRIAPRVLLLNTLEQLAAKVANPELDAGA